MYKEILLTAIGLIGKDTILTIQEYNDRQYYYQIARQVSNILNKPLLVVGEPKMSIHHGYGDITIDISPTKPNVIKMDVLDIDKYYPYKYFGCVYISHVLEHLPKEKLYEAIEKLLYVSNCVIALYPKYMKIILGIIHPEHHVDTLFELWRLSKNGILIICDPMGYDALLYVLNNQVS